MLKNFAEMLAAAQRKGPQVLAVAMADERDILAAAVEARALHIADPILVGPRERIRAIAAEGGLDLHDVFIVDEPDARAAGMAAVHLVRSGDANLLMKGRMDMADLLHIALDREMGIRAGRLFSQVSAFEIPGFERILFVTDAGVVVEPTLEQKAQIVQNAIDAARQLGTEEPRVAVLAALEMVNPKMQSTMDAANLSKMADRGQIKGGLVDGPLALDNAISLQSALVKGINSPVAGRADILVAPDVEAGNILAKGITYFGHGKVASVVVGSEVPIIATSRADPSEDKLASIALAVLLAHE
ncbi:MAG: bifunctional enoyl-CoA hydratase/phosphate acetyltransferase [Dehalococcoidales bacterium]|nr:bifunctional enoyl-CoA hydratase/phosphate acetyltransferase [Dehalococcoidales bacterium]